MRRLLIFFTVFLGAGILLSQQAVHWPTDASNVLTSSFGEFRPDHFHIGIDVKTWGREGFAVFAAGNGYVSKVSVSPWGYGKVIFLRLDSGMTAVYAHLSAFCPRLNPFVREKQEEQHVYTVSLRLPAHLLRVRQGDILGYTGSTGIGYPHLHFELRDSFNRPVNPLKYFSSIVRDVSPPAFINVALSPIGSESRVQDDVLPRIARPEKVSGTEYRINEPVYARGAAGLSVEVLDRDGQVHNRLRPYRIALYIDGTAVFSVTCDTIAQDQIYKIANSREFRLYTGGRGSYYSLYRINRDPMPFTYGKPHAGIICTDAAGSSTGAVYVEPGCHEFIISAEDYFGNESRVTGTIVMTGSNDPVQRQYGEIWKRADMHRNGRGVNHTLAGTNLRYFIKGESRNSLPQCYVTMNSWLKQPVPLITDGSTGYIGIVPLDSTEHTEVVCSFVSSDTSKEAVSDTAYVWRLSPQTVSVLFSSDGMFSVSVRPNSVTEPCHVAVRKEIFPWKKNAVTHAYTVYPYIRLRRKIEIRFALAGFCARGENTAIYRVSPSGMSMLPTVCENGYISASVRGFGTFTVMRDTVPPVIVSAEPENESVSYTAFPEISAVFTDSLSGIGGESCYRFYVDGRKYIAEYDPENNCALALVRESLSRGRHSLRVQIFDRAGNMSEVNRNFYVLPGGGVQ